MACLSMCHFWRQSGRHEWNQGPLRILLYREQLGDLIVLNKHLPDKAGNVLPCPLASLAKWGG